jgi:hypothetical protein
MTWQTTYPTVATVKSAHYKTLSTWDETLPEPQTDVERTVRKRISKRLFGVTAAECREKAPEVAKAWNDLADTLKRMGVGDMERM